MVGRSGHTYRSQNFSKNSDPESVKVFFFNVLLNKETWSLKCFKSSSLPNSEPCKLAKKDELR